MTYTDTTKDVYEFSVPRRPHLTKYLVGTANDADNWFTMEVMIYPDASLTCLGFPQYF